MIFFHGSTYVAHKNSGSFAHGCLRKMFFFFLHARVNEISDFMHVLHMKYPFLHVFVLHVYFETPPLEKENCGKLLSLGGGA